MIKIEHENVLSNNNRIEKLLSDKQKEFIRNAHHRINFKIGARRCGKTYLDILYMIPKRIRERRHKDGLNVILGVSKGTIERNVLQPLRQIYGIHRVSTIDNNNKAKLFGQEVYCLGAEKVSQVSKIQGSSIKYLYGDEIAKWNEEVFMMVLGSLDQEYSCFDGALNPENKNHWLKKKIIDKAEEKGLDLYLQHYTIFDNPFLSKQFVENLCKEYQGTVFYNRLILGQWCDAEGIIFPSIANNQNRYITEVVNQNGFISIGIDWGGNGSKHSITATRIPRDYSKPQVLRSETKVATGTTTDELFKWIISFIQEVIIEFGSINTIWCDSAEQVLINTLRKELAKVNLHIPVKDSIKTEIKERIRIWTILLNTDRLSFVKDKCNSLIEALQTALFDDKAKDDRWLDDGTSDIDSLDSYNYSIEYWYPQLAREGV